MKKSNVILIICLVFILVGCSEEKENKIIIYVDYKCPYCKKVETNIVLNYKKMILIKIRLIINL